MPALLPSGLNDFADKVVPELQRRGLFRTEYTGNTLRERYGLTRPANRSQATEESRKETSPATKFTLDKAGPKSHNVLLVT